MPRGQHYQGAKGTAGQEQEGIKESTGQQTEGAEVSLPKAAAGEVSGRISPGRPGTG